MQGQIRRTLEIHSRLVDALVILGTSLVFAILAGLATGRFGLIVAPLATGVLGVVLVLVIGKRLWWVLLYVILTGYMFASRGFAGIGFFPVFIGEIVMAVGLLTILLAPFSPHIQLNNLTRYVRWEVLILVVLLIWSVINTVPYIPEYQFDTIRDAVLYLYAIFALIIMFLIPKKWVQGFFDYYSLIIPFMLLWFPVLFFISRLELLPIYLPGSDVPLIHTKGTDIGVHLAGIGAYLMLGLDRHKKFYPASTSWLLWMLWAVNVLLYGSLGRSNMLVCALALVIVLILKPRSRWDRPLILGVTILAIMIVTNLYSTLEIDLGLPRKVSPEQLVENAVSIIGVGNNAAGDLETTKQWRLAWWDEIGNYTFNGDYFWTGKGYGVNLANADGFQVEEDESLRSPHNGHLTYLARSGVPGFLLWMGFLAAYGFMLVWQVLTRAKARPWESKYAVWLLAYIAAHAVMASFDVFIEGPMGGIWFWALIGMGLVYFSDPTPVTDDLIKNQAGQETDETADALLHEN